MGTSSFICSQSNNRKRKPYNNNLVRFIANENIPELNATLQCLCHIQIFVTYLKGKFNQIKEINSYKIFDKQGKNLTNSLKDLIDNIYNHKLNDETKIIPIQIETNNFYEMFLKINQNYDINNNCLINTILMRLHDELNKAQVGSIQGSPILDENNLNNALMVYMNIFSSNNKSKISDYFFGTYYTFTKCMNCGNEIYKPKAYISQFFNLEDVRKFKYESCMNNLNILYSSPPDCNIINIMDCLYYDRQGKPNPESNQICKKCGVITNINYLTIIYTLPNILIFIFNKANLIPNVKYSIQQQINIDFFVDQKQNKIYDLIGVIFNPYQKKYIALCKSFLNKLWYSYDDENAKLIDDIQIEFNNYDNPYMLIYQ